MAQQDENIEDLVLITQTSPDFSSNFLGASQDETSDGWGVAFSSNASLLVGLDCEMVNICLLFIGLKYKCISQVCTSSNSMELARVSIIGCTGEVSVAIWSLLL